MTDQELRDLVASLTIDVKSMREAQAETTRKLEKIGVLAGNISNNQGDIAEEYFYNSLKDKQILAGIHYDRIDKNVTSSSSKVSDEFDIVMVNGNDVAIIEVKYKAHDKDLEKLITKKYENFKTLYPMYKDYNHHLVLASFNINEDLKQEALEKGVIVLQRKGDIMETTVP